MSFAYTDENREEIIRNSIKSATDKNITLTTETYGVDWSKTKERWLPKKDAKCCPLGCVVLECQDSINIKRIGNWRTAVLQTILGCDPDWLESFRKGFDGHPRQDADQNAFPYDLGFVLRGEMGKDKQLSL